MKHLVWSAAGVFVGTILSQIEDTIVLENARRIWYWSGAATLSELSQKGVSRPENCKFPAEIPVTTLFKVVEVIPMTDAAMASINAVPAWTEHKM